MKDFNLMELLFSKKHIQLFHLTGPARSSLFTGKSPDTLQIYNVE